MEQQSIPYKAKQNTVQPPVDPATLKFTNPKTEDEAIILGKEMIAWLHIDSNVFFNKFLSERLIRPGQIKKLRETYESFDRLIETAQYIQEWKLADKGAHGKLNPYIVRLVLSNKHSWKDTTEDTDKNKKLKSMDEKQLHDELKKLIGEVKEKIN